MEIHYDGRFGQPDEDVLRKLELSAQETKGMRKRDLRCPICGYRIEGVYEDRIGHVEVKCRKCKFEGPVNLAYFRRQVNRRRSFFVGACHSKTEEC